VYRSFAQWLKIHPAFILAVILLLQVSQIIFYMDKRKELFYDETTSFVTSSLSSYRIQSNNQLSSSMVVSPENRWRFAFVSTHGGDYNPHFFYLQLHAIASLFPNTFSKWFALINLFWFMLTGIVLYFLSRLILKNDLTAILPTLLWGFSGATVSMAYYIRAYATVCFFAVLFIYLSCLLINKDKSNIKLYIFLAITMFFGMFSHYYFLIWAFFICVFAGIYLLFVRRHNDVFKYATAIVLGIGLNFLLFYNLLIRHFVRSSPSAIAGKSLSNFNIDDFIKSITICFKQINLFVFDNSLGIIFIVLGLILISFVAVFIKKNFKAVDGGEGQFSLPFNVNKIVVFDYKIILILATCILYLIVVSHISQFKALRYFYLTTPSLVLLSIIIFDYFLSFILRIKQIAKRVKFDERKIKNVLLSVIILMLVLSGFYTGKQPSRPIAHPYFSNPKFMTVLSGLNIVVLTTTEYRFHVRTLLPYISQNIYTLDNKIKENNNWQTEFIKVVHPLNNFLFCIALDFIDKNGNMNDALLDFLHKNGFYEQLISRNFTHRRFLLYKISRTKQEGQQ
jgi:hypothetical protein